MVAQRAVRALSDVGAAAGAHARTHIGGARFPPPRVGVLPRARQTARRVVQALSPRRNRRFELISGMWQLPSVTPRVSTLSRRCRRVAAAFRPYLRDAALPSVTPVAAGKKEGQLPRKQISMPLKAGHPERPTGTLGWSLEHPLGILTNNVFLLDVCGQPIRVASQ